jgi:hypothetical protein
LLDATDELELCATLVDVDEDEDNKEETEDTLDVAEELVVEDVELATDEFVEGVGSFTPPPHADKMLNSISPHTYL